MALVTLVAHSYGPLLAASYALNTSKIPFDISATATTATNSATYLMNSRLRTIEDSTAALVLAAMVALPWDMRFSTNISLGSGAGYGGGIWRKKWLLEHEAKVAYGVQTLF